VHYVLNPDTPFGEGIRVGRLYRRHKHVHTFRPEHVIEPTAELRVPIAHKKAHAAPPLLQREQQVAGLLGGPGGVGIGGDPGQVDPAAAQFEEEQDVQPPQPDCVDGEEVKR
jgi:hypothetical protein